MSYIFAKISKRGNTEKIRKVLQTDDELYELAGNLIEESVPYNPETVLESGMWYYITGVSSSCFSIDILTKEINSVDYDMLTGEEFMNMEYIFSVSRDNDELYFQKTGRTSLMQKRNLLSFGGNFEYRTDCSTVVINENPDAIYIKSSDTLYFRKLSSISGIFPEINSLYREATREETVAFLSMDFLSTEGLTVEKISIPNRRRIALAMEVLEGLNFHQRDEIFSYITEYCADIRGEDNIFHISDNKELSLLLLGIEQRFYTTRVGGERRIANSVIKL